MKQIFNLSKKHHIFHQVTAKFLICLTLMLNVTAIPIKSVAAVAPSGWVSIPPKVDPLMLNLNIPADAATRGMWSPSIPWSLNSIHAIVLSDGRLLTFGTPFGNAGAQDGRSFDVWNPENGFLDAAHVRSNVPDPVNSFCGTSGWLQNGQLLVSGGNGNGGRSSGLFTTTNNSTTNLTSTLAGERWYASMVGLADGRQLILGGTVPYTNPRFPTPEILENGAWRSLFGASSTPIFASRVIGNTQEANPWYYPRAWLAPNGNVFGITSNIMFSINPNANNGNGSITDIGRFKTTQDQTSATTPNVGFTSTAVMYAPGRILQVGGNGITDNNPNIASQNATVIDINGANPVITETNPMNFRRHWSYATVIPDGKVVVTGGTTVGWNPANRVGPAEIWNPNTGTWTVGASSADTRTYHSSAVLLPNGTIFTGGGGAPGAVNNLNMEIYYPPNLFANVNGRSQLAVRPTISAVSSLQVAYGATLGVQMSSAQNISRLALIQTGSSTHGYNNTQRYIPLNFTQNGTLLNAQLPANANLAPTGYYMLFAVDANGVPSSSVMLGVGGVKAPPLSYIPPNLPADAALCSGEYAQCTIPTGRTATVYYGANGSYFNRQGVSGTIDCNNATFGDPNNQVVKSCYVVLNPLVTALPDINVPIINAGATATYAPIVNMPNTQYSWNFGDGSPATAFNVSPNITHVFAGAGVYQVFLTARLADGRVINRNYMQAVATARTAVSPTNSSPIVVERRLNSPSSRVWVVNPDNDSVSVMDTTSRAILATVNVGKSPRTIAIGPDGRVWVANKESSTISIISPTTLAVVQTINLPRSSQPHGLIFAPNGTAAYVVLEATGQVIKFDGLGNRLAVVNVGSNVRHIANAADNQTLLVSRFITPPLPGESSASVDTSTTGGEVIVVNAAGNMAVTRTITLRHSDKVDTEAQGSGIPNYLAAPAISPDGTTAWVPSKQDNIKRGMARNAQNLNFQNTIRAISSRIDMGTLTEDYAKRVDHDNSSLGSAAIYHPSGAYLFVALETSRQVAVMDAIRGAELFKINVGRAPQGLAISPLGNVLYVQDFMDRSISTIDLTPLTFNGKLATTLTGATYTVTTEKLPANVVLGKQLFYDAKDPRLSRDSYMSCATCHNDGAHDGRVWDLTGFGEGLRNTIALKGRAGMGHGFLHWSANFDEVQDFEGQIRTLSGGTGLMNEAQFNTGTRNQPLGDRKAGVSADLDNLAAYVGSLNTFAPSPSRNADGSLTAAATAGRAVFNTTCVSCHTGNNFTRSLDATTLANVGTINPLSGRRLNVALTGFDVPTLRDVWATAPYLHNGSAPTITAAIQAHTNLTLNATDLANVAAYVQQVEGNNTDSLISQGKAATQSTLDWGGLPARAVDGNTSGLYANNSITHTTNENQPWWQVDLGGTFSLSQVNIWNRMDACCAIRLQNFYVLSSNNDMTGKTLSQLLADPTVTKVQVGSLNGQASTTVQMTNAQARYVRVQLMNLGMLSLAEVQVYGSATAPIPPSNALPPANAINCAGENGTCTIPTGSTATVWYGANTSWAVKTGLAGSVACNNANFGDPIRGTVKSCRYQITSATANVPPTASLTSPANNATFTQGTAITISANAADSDGTVAKVDFFDGATLIGTDTTAPYSVNWTSAPAGIRSITARATDNAGAVTTSTVVTVTVNAPAVLGVADGIYRLVAVHSGQVLDIQDISLADGALATQWPWTAGSNQRWQVTARGNGQFTLTALHSGKLLEVAGCSLADGGRVQQWPANGAPCQSWRIENLNDGSYRLVNISSGKVLDVSTISQTAGAAVHQWTWLNGANQRWRLERQ